MLQVAGAPLGKVRRQRGHAARVERGNVRLQSPGGNRPGVGRERRIASPPRKPRGSAADPVRRLGEQETERQTPGAAQTRDQALNRHRDP